MPRLAGSDGSPLVAWPFVVKFLVLPRRPPAVLGLRCHHPPPRAPLETTAGMRTVPTAPRSPPRSIIVGYHREGPHRFTKSPPYLLLPLSSTVSAERLISLSSSRHC